MADFLFSETASKDLDHRAAHRIDSPARSSRTAGASISPRAVLRGALFEEAVMAACLTLQMVVELGKDELSIVIHGRAVTLNHQPFRTIYQSLINQWRRSRFRMRLAQDASQASERRLNPNHRR